MVRLYAPHLCPGRHFITGGSMVSSAPASEAWRYFDLLSRVARNDNQEDSRPWRDSNPRSRAALLFRGDGFIHFHYTASTQKGQLPSAVFRGCWPFLMPLLYISSCGFIQTLSHYPT